MARWISVDEARSSFPSLLDIVIEKKEPIIIEEDGKRLAVVISPEDFDRLREHLWEAVERIRARMPDRDPDEVLREVTEVVEEVRQELYEQRQAVAQSSR
jgi:prevent-host-death family protein